MKSHRIIGVWLLLACIAVTCGAVREAVLTPAVGELRAHQIGTLAVCAIFFGVCWAALPVLKLTSSKQAWTVGTIWVLMTVAFEFGFGHYVFENSWSRILDCYNVLRGRIWVLVVIVTWIGPAAAFRLRGSA